MSDKNRDEAFNATWEPSEVQQAISGVNLKALARMYFNSGWDARTTDPLPTDIAGLVAEGREWQQTLEKKAMGGFLAHIAQFISRLCDALESLSRPAEGLHPEFVKGYLAAADDLEEPYPPDIPMFAPPSKEEIEKAVEAMGGDMSGRLHAEWARHWARALRQRIVED